MKIKPNFLLAWIFLTAALALHVIDEALNDFLDLYNPLVLSVNNEMGFSFFPVFSFSSWLTALTIGIAFLFALSYFVYRRQKWTIYLGYFYGVLMLINAFGHLIGSLYYSRLIAGVYTAPLLLAGSLYLIWSCGHVLNSNNTKRN